MINNFNIGVLFILSLLAHAKGWISLPGLNIESEFHTRVLAIDTPFEYLMVNLYIGYIQINLDIRAFYYLTTLRLGIILEELNSLPKTEERI